MELINRYKSYLTIIILCLANEDVVHAKEEFMENLQDSQYLKAKECEISESLITAFENCDSDELEAMQKGPKFNYLDNQV